MTQIWTTEDNKNAAAQGWELHDVWDAGKHCSEVEIFRHEQSNVFLTDEAARAFVASRGRIGDDMATRAMRIMFNSKVGGGKK